MTRTRTPGLSRAAAHTAMTCIAAMVLVLVVGCNRAAPRHAKLRFFRMDTVTEITVVVRGTTDNEMLWRDIDSLLADWERRFSVSGEGSEVATVNRSAAETIPVSPTLAHMVHDARRYGDTLDGMFDLTILPLKRLWGLDEESSPDSSHAIPDSHSIAQTLQRVDYRLVDATFEPYAIIKHNPDIQIDVGGIAKGYVQREIARLLRRRGYDDFLVSAGGDVLVQGRRADGAAWRIGIQHPRNKQHLLATLDIDSGMVVTSGDYERFWMAGSIRVHHIFDPRTGRSCTSNQSVTIHSPDPIEADVLNTGLFCLPADSILAFVEQRPHLEVLVVDSSGRAMASSGWRKRVEWTQPPSTGSLKARGDVAQGEFGVGD